jgi:hypothetical protein
MTDTENTYCSVCDYEHSFEEISWDLAGNAHCVLCGELLEVPPEATWELNFMVWC